MKIPENDADLTKSSPKIEAFTRIDLDKVLIDDKPEEQVEHLLGDRLTMYNQVLAQAFDGETNLSEREWISALLGYSLVILASESLRQGDAAEGNPISPNPPGWVTRLHSALDEFVEEDPLQRGILRETIFLDSDPERQQILHEIVSASVKPGGEYSPLEFAIGVVKGQLVSQPRDQD